MLSIQSQINDILQRNITLHGTSLEPQLGADGKPTGKFIKVASDKAVKESLNALLKMSDGDVKTVAEQLIAAEIEGTNGPIQQSLNAARVTQVSNWIMAMSTWRSAFFQVETLAPDEEAWISNTDFNEIGIIEGGADGKAMQDRLIPRVSRTAVAQQLIVSKLIRYSTLDLVRGDISAHVTATFNIANDLNAQYENKFYNLLTTGCFSEFATEQALADLTKRIYRAHSLVDTGHLPTTNVFTNVDVKAWDGGKDGLSGFRPAVTYIPGAYCNRWGRLLPDANGTALQPTGDIIVPAKDIEKLSQQAIAPNGTFETDAQKRILANGADSFVAAGRNYRFLPDPTIPSGTCYPIFNLKVGKAWDKPNWNGEQVNRNTAEHWEERQQSRFWSAAIIAQWRPRAIKITYVNPS